MDSNNNNNVTNSDDDKHNNPLPAHLKSIHYYNKRKGGWEGDEMEMQHQKMQQRLQQSAVACSTTNGYDAAIVDLNQFRNEEVGIGYQAKGVVRQKVTGGDGENRSMRIIDMTKRKINEEDEEDEDAEDEEKADNEDGDNAKKRRSKKRRSKKKSKKRKHNRKYDNDDYSRCSSRSSISSRKEDSGDDNEQKRKSKKTKHASSRSRKKEVEEGKTPSSSSRLVQQCLQCEAVRIFRREIEKIVIEAS